MRERPAPSPFNAVMAGIIAFAVVGLIEFIWLAARGVVDDSDALVRTALHLVGLCGALGAVVGVLLALIVPAMVVTLRPGDWLRRNASPHGSDATPTSALNDGAAWGFAALGALAPFALVAAAAGYLAHGFNQRLYATAFVGLAAVGALLVGVLVMFPLKVAVRWGLDRVAPMGRLFGLPTPALPLLTVLAIGAAMLWRVSRIDLGAYQLEGYYLAAAATVLALVLLAWRRGRAPLRMGVASVAVAVLVLGAAGFTVGGLAQAPVAARVIALDANLGRVALAAGRWALDFDGDGASGLLAGGDCAEGDPNIGPFAKEIPGNGIDENCQGGDAKLEVAAPPPPPEPDAPSYTPKKLNVLFILIDTLRPDHLGLYGYERNTSPNIDAWAKDAVVFDRVWAHAPNTPRSTPSILLGRYPSRIDWDDRFKNYSDVEPANESVFEIFQAGGWRTEAVSAHWYFERAPGLKAGVDQWDNRGFLTIKESNTQSAAPDLTPRVIERLTALGPAEQPFFLFVHYFDPHGKYMQQTSVRTFGKGLMDKYDSEIAFVDHHLQPVFDALEAQGLYDDTVVVVTSDHGEAFKEHGFHFHGRTLYDEETRVPLIMRVPGVAARRVERATALVDLVPTLAGLVGLEAKQPSGQNLVPLLFELGELPERTIFAENLPYPNYKTHVVAAIGPDGYTKAVRNVTDNVTEVFDLRADPAEKVNLLDKDPDAAKALREALLGFIDADPGE